MILNWILPSLVLLVSSYQDLRARKVENKIVLTLVLVCFAASIFLSFKDQFLFSDGLLGLIAAFTLMLPLYLIKAIGAADVKVFMIVGYLIGPNSTFSVFIFSLICATLFGFIKIILDKKLVLFFQNIKKIIQLQTPEKSDLQTIPYTVALFAGWLCQMTYIYYGRIS